MGLEQLYQLRFEKLFRQFETLIQEHARTLDRDYFGETGNTIIDDGQIELDLGE
jgi:hypothetical protein